MHFRLLVAWLLAGAGALPAQGGYYNGVDDSSPQRLRQTLHELIDDHQIFPYTSSSRDTWDILETAMQDPSSSGRILDVYKNASYRKHGRGNSDYEREHTWPKSYGFPVNDSRNYPYTDCHALFLCHIAYNRARSNKPFRNCSSSCSEQPTDLNNGQGGGRGRYPGNSNWTTGDFSSGTWEVWNGRRGDIARVMFYMDVRYAGGRHGRTGWSEPDLILTDDIRRLRVSSSNQSVGYMAFLSVLLQWHKQDPVDAVERRKNDVVFSFQGNRNPFVDRPEWVDCLFSGRCRPGQRGTFTTYGRGCVGSNGVPMLSAFQNQTPKTGQNFVMLLGSLPFAGGVFGMLGGSKTRWGSIQLPFDLRVIGMPGCDMLASPDIMMSVRNNGGAGVWPIAIPNESRLVGSEFHGQAVVLDRGANAFGATVTNGGTGKIGNQ